MFSFESWRLLSAALDVLYEVLGIISKLQFFDQKKLNIFFSWIRIRTQNEFRSETLVVVNAWHWLNHVQFNFSLPERAAILFQCNWYLLARWAGDWQWCERRWTGEWVGFWPALLPTAPSLLFTFYPRSILSVEWGLGGVGGERGGWRKKHKNANWIITGTDYLLPVGEAGLEAELEAGNVARGGGGENE
jgi:hypothetical protein